MGRFPGSVGMPGLRWYDRERSTCRFPDYSRSYVGAQVNLINRDLDPDAATLFEICERSMGALTPISRGLSKKNRVGRVSLRTAVRVARTHFSGNVAGWLDIDREASDLVLAHLREKRPEFAFIALLGIDKTSHSAGQPSPQVDEALSIVESLVERLRRNAEDDGTWKDTHLWITSDHGHSPVTAHEDLAGRFSEWGFRTMAHPWVVKWRPEVAVMVSGNAMAHVYLDLGHRHRRPLAELDTRFRSVVDRLRELASVDVLLMPLAGGAEVQSAERGTATVKLTGDRLSYHRQSGDPLGLERNLCNVTFDEAYDATIRSDYPDSLLQIARIAESPRSGDIILSASRNWDFRSSNEPIPHVSSHGALHRDHMLVPLLTNRRYVHRPQRTTDVMPSALAALHRPIPPGLDGRSFI
jgi:hypothetical protein